MPWMSILDTKENTPKNAKKTANSIILNIKMSTKGGPVFTFSLPGGRLAPSFPPPSVTPLAAALPEKRKAKDSP